MANMETSLATLEYLAATVCCNQWTSYLVDGHRESIFDWRPIPVHCGLIATTITLLKVIEAHQLNLVTQLLGSNRLYTVALP